MSDPQRTVTDANVRLAQAQAALAAANGDDRAQLQAQLDEARRGATEASRVAKQRGDEFRLMRNDVFHTDDAQKEAEARLRARHASDDEVRAFEQQAARASTPAQIEALENKAKK